MFWKDLRYEGNGCECKHYSEATNLYNSEITISRNVPNGAWDVRFRKDLKEKFCEERSKRVGLQATVCGIGNVERLYQELMAPECTQFYATSLFESKTTELRVLSNNIFNDPVSESVVSVSDRCDDEGLPQFAFEIRLCRNISRPHTGAQIRDDYRCLIEEAAVTYHSLHKILAL